MTRKLSLCAFAILAVVIGCAPLLAQSTPYFQGKTIILVQGREPGTDRLPELIMTPDPWSHGGDVGDSGVAGRQCDVDLVAQFAQIGVERLGHG